MSEYLVRWKFGPDSLLNHRDVETTWYQQTHSSKKAAVDHYTSLLYHSSPSMAMTTEIFQLVQLIPGQTVTNDAVEETVTANKEFKDVENQIRDEQEKVLSDLEIRNKKIMNLFKKGHTRTAIAEKMKMNYQTVCNIIRQSSEG